MREHADGYFVHFISTLIRRNYNKKQVIMKRIKVLIKRECAVRSVAAEAKRNSFPR